MHGRIDDPVVIGSDGDLGAGSPGPAGDEDSGDGLLGVLDGPGEIDSDVGCSSSKLEVWV